MRKYGLLMVLLLFLIPVQARGLSAQDADGLGWTIQAQQISNGETYLFLPAYLEGRDVTFTAKSGTTLMLNGGTIGQERASAGVSSGDVLTMRVGKSESTAHILVSSGIPAIHLRTESGSLNAIHKDKSHKEAAQIEIVLADGEVSFEGDVKAMKGHGNATFQFKKKSYQIAFKKKTSLLGLNAQKKFILLANQHENSLVRNRITMELADAVGLRYSPGCMSVDLYVNEEYLGNYLLCNKVTVSSGSVDIMDSEEAIELANPELTERDVVPESYGTKKATANTYKGTKWPAEPEDVTGGFLFQLEYAKRYPDEVSGVVTKRGQPIIIKSPENMTPGQGAYFNDLIQSFDRAIAASDGVDPVTGKHYTQMADTDSLVLKYMIEEISKNYDGNKSSQFFYKDSDLVDPLIYAGPVWDYDSAWGNYAGEGRLDIAAPKGLTIGETSAAYAWWPTLYRHEEFQKRVRELYVTRFRPRLLVLAGSLAAYDGCGVRSLDEYAAELNASAQMNFKRWNILNAANRAVKTGASYAENIEYLRSWILDRVSYLDTRWMQ